jgi:hypothetical protein
MSKLGARLAIGAIQTSHQVENRTNRIYEAGVGVKQELSTLRLRRQARWFAGGNMRDLQFG